MASATLPAPDERSLKKLLDLIERLLAEIPNTDEPVSRSPEDRAREIARNAAIKAAMVSGSLALPQAARVPDNHSRPCRHLENSSAARG